jgi:hypothetical protein
VCRCRCIQVAQNEGEDDPTAWAEFTVKVKEAILATFDTNVALYEEDVRKADSQRQLQGWQYGTFFLQKVSIEFVGSRIRTDEFEEIGSTGRLVRGYDPA